jgi:dihydrodipicolinate reductase
MTDICFAGVTGWTTPPILESIRRAEDLHLVAGVSRSAAGQSLAEATGIERHGQVYATAAEAVQATSVDVLVDYTSASAVKANAVAAIDTGTHVVVGSSDLTADDYADLDQRARSRGVEYRRRELLGHGGDPSQGGRPGPCSASIVFAGPGERLTVRHDPGLTPASYVDGTLLAIRKVAEVAGLRRGLDSLLFDGPPGH